MPLLRGIVLSDHDSVLRLRPSPEGLELYQGKGGDVKAFEPPKKLQYPLITEYTLNYS